MYCFAIARTICAMCPRSWAVQVARSTEGVKRVDDRLSIGMASRDDAGDDAVGTSGAKDDAKEAARLLNLFKRMLPKNLAALEM